MSRGRILVLVSNDLTFDQRVRKTCASLQRAGYEPVLLGRRMSPDASTEIDRPYPTERIWLPYLEGPRFYWSFQKALFAAMSRWYAKGQVVAVWSNDLDTLWPAVKVARQWGLDIAYDSHEWFTEAEGLKGAPLKKAAWRWWEKRCFRALRRMITVNHAIADAYRKAGLEVGVVPNVPERSDTALVPMPRAELGWPEDKTVMLMQGAFMDRDRGALDAVRSLVHLPDVHLALIGAGPEHAMARELAEGIRVSERLHVHDRMPYDVLKRCTAAADIGLSLDRPTVDNFRFSLPNKLFDSLHAGVPVVCSDLPVAGRFVAEEGIGEVAASAQGDAAIAKSVANAVQALMDHPPSSAHLAAVAERHHWGAHEEALLGAIHAPR